LTYPRILQDRGYYIWHTTQQLFTNLTLRNKMSHHSAVKSHLYVNPVIHTHAQSVARKHPSWCGAQIHSSTIMKLNFILRVQPKTKSNVTEFVSTWDLTFSACSDGYHITTQCHDPGNHYTKCDYRLTDYSTYWLFRECGIIVELGQVGGNRGIWGKWEKLVPLYQPQIPFGMPVV
jgi:hypothetical protein